MLTKFMFFLYVRSITECHLINKATQRKSVHWYHLSSNPVQ